MPDHPLVEQLDQAIDSMLAGASRAEGGDPELAALVQVATALRDLPGEEFKTRLKTELEKESSYDNIDIHGCGIPHHHPIHHSC